MILSWVLLGLDFMQQTKAQRVAGIKLIFLSTLLYLPYSTFPYSTLLTILRLCYLHLFMTHVNQVKPYA